MSQILDCMERQGYATWHHSIPDGLPEDVAAAYTNALTISDEELGRTQLWRGFENETPLGYTRKEGRCNKNGEWEDAKRIFHYDAGGDVAAFPPVADLARRHPEFREFLESIAELTFEAEREANAILEEIAGENLAFLKMFRRNGRIPNFQIRINAYDAGSAGEICAGGHFDKSGTTLHIYESAPGLTLVHNGEEIPFTSTPGKMALFPGLLLAREVKRVKALWHYVRQPPGHRVEERISRISIVGFVDWLVGAGNVPDYRETHALS